MATGKTMRKITISLPEALVDFADDHAKALHTSRSEVIGMALSAIRSRTEEQLAAEGYRFYSQEASEFADAISGAIVEAWSEDKSDAQDEEV